MVEGYFQLLRNADSLMVGHTRFCSGRLRVEKNMGWGQGEGRASAGSSEKRKSILRVPLHVPCPHWHVRDWTTTLVLRGWRDWFGDGSLLWLMKGGWKRHRDGGCSLRESIDEASHAALTCREALKPLVCQWLMITSSREDWIEVGGNGTSQNLVINKSWWHMARTESCT